MSVSRPHDFECRFGILHKIRDHAGSFCVFGYLLAYISTVHTGLRSCWSTDVGTHLQVPYRTQMLHILQIYNQNPGLSTITSYEPKRVIWAASPLGFPAIYISDSRTQRAQSQVRSRVPSWRFNQAGIWFFNRKLGEIIKNYRTSKTSFQCDILSICYHALRKSNFM